MVLDSDPCPNHPVNTAGSLPLRPLGAWLPLHPRASSIASAARCAVYASEARHQPQVRAALTAHSREWLQVEDRLSLPSFSISNEREFVRRTRPFLRSQFG